MRAQALHGYKTMQWTGDAKLALGREQSRLVARLVANEMTDSILEWMLEGWHFGERKSKLNVRMPLLLVPLLLTLAHCHGLNCTSAMYW
jgi:hypothetical protein